MKQDIRFDPCHVRFNHPFAITARQFMGFGRKIVTKQQLSKVFRKNLPKLGGILLQDDLETVMGESTHTVLGINWRAWLKDVIDDITNQLSALGFVVSSDLDDEGEKGILRINGTAIQVAYRPVDDGDFDPMIAAINRAIAPRARYRKFASCEGSDGWFYAVLAEETWRHLTTVAESSVNSIFRV